MKNEKGVGCGFMSCNNSPDRNDVWEDAGMDEIVDSDYKIMLDSLVTIGVYVIKESDHRILFYNKRVKEVSPNLKIGDICHEIWDGYCENCPLHVIGEKPYARTISYDDPFGKIVDITATRMLWKNKVPAFLIRVYPRIGSGEFETLSNSDLNLLQSGEADKISPIPEVIPDDETGTYSVCSYFSKEKDILPENHNDLLLELLKSNGANGVIVGCSDAPQKILFIDALALTILQYPSCAVFKRDTNNLMGSLLKDSEEAQALAEKAEYYSAIHRNHILKGYQGVSVPVVAVSRSVSARNGQKLWYCAIRPLGDRYVDHLTGGATRLGFISQLEEMRIKGIDLTQYDIMYLNIDDFKAVNDLYTTKGGDDLLKMIYMMIVRSELEPIVSGRLESDHFIALFEKKNIVKANPANLQHIPWTYNGKTMNIRAKCGIYPIKNVRMSISAMIDRAKLAKKYIVDEHSKPYAIYNKRMRDEYLNQAEVIAEYQEALLQKQFKVYYQPVVDAKTGKIVSAEALIRWEHPLKGLVSPAVFLTALEHNGSISRVDEYVNDEVRSFLINRSECEKSIVPISVNLSWMDFYDDNFLERLSSVAREEKLPDDTIRYEITETSYSALEGNWETLLKKLKQRGTKILLDDFGSGVSSFGMIQKYAFDILKLDMTFIRQIGVNNKVNAIIEAVITMCHALDIKVIAEGVETSEQAEYLKAANCDYLQGYYFAKPLPQEQFEKFLDENQ